MRSEERPNFGAMAARPGWRMWRRGVLAVVTCGVVWVVSAQRFQERIAMAADKSAGPHLVHNVYFTLNESTPENRRRLLDACHRYLTDHPGTVYFSCGVRTPDLQRPVNDQTYDVGLHVVFDSRAAHDAYQVHPRHIQFIEENRATWKEVRVFDDDVASP